ncbi:MAG: hypothetical protein AN484_27810 [Aphanizomenon flos-aquae WA102]|uniref:Uncharacterized protein n=1 Tax=Aphanizomenon flos-aquae WA102 TaxID=1710896 RepID=A0A1B7W640_APHFL|nr:MAG: hypothetical protein AN484_27810 [Aphanizomenon flos-aquae WA102]
MLLNPFGKEKFEKLTDPPSPEYPLTPAGWEKASIRAPNSEQLKGGAPAAASAQTIAKPINNPKNRVFGQ